MAGRRPVSDEPRVQMNTRVPKSIRERLEVESAERDVSLSVLISSLLEDALDRLDD